MQGSKHLSKQYMFQKGLTLIEMAIAIVIVGIMLAGALSLYNSAGNQQKERETRKRMDVVKKALADYVEAANRLPCPADPAIGKDYVIGGMSQEAAFGWERGVRVQDLKISGTRPTGDCNTHDDPRNREGIVPFATLNIPYEMTRDAWGNYFTYAVSPVFTMRTDLANNAGERDDNVHPRCREVGWIIGSDPANAPKARFCCAQYPDTFSVDDKFLPETDLRVQLASDISNDITKDISPKRDNPVWGAGLNLTNRLMNENSPNQLYPKTYEGSIEAPAFVLISHGRNGRGAYIGTDEPPAKRNGTAAGLEWQNADISAVVSPEDAQLYYAGRQKFAGANYFDDIVVWMTQDQIMAYNGTSSCRYP